MTRTIIGFCLAMVCMGTACGHNPAQMAPTTVRTIQISDVIMPEVLYARQGEEIRWMNTRRNTIRLGFLSMKLLDEVGCEKGVKTLFGEVNDLVSIAPGESAGLCFIRSGELKYNVWFDPGNPQGAISPTATIRVERGS